MNLYEKINLIMADVKSLQKDGRVAYKNTNYNFLSEAKTTEKFHEAFTKVKVALLPIKAEETKEGTLTRGCYTYRLIDCENPEDFIDLQAWGQGQDSGDKGSGKASSYAYKYLLWRTFAIPSNDDPDQISSDEFKAKEREEELKKLDKQSGSDINDLLKFFKVKSISDLSDDQYQKGVNGYHKKIKKEEGSAKDEQRNEKPNRANA